MVTSVKSTQINTFHFIYRNINSLKDLNTTLLY